MSVDRTPQVRDQNYVLVAVTAGGTLIRDGQFSEAVGDRLVKMVPLVEVERLRDALVKVEQLPGRMHPTAGYIFDSDPRKIARAALEV